MQKETPAVLKVQIFEIYPKMKLYLKFEVSMPIDRKMMTISIFTKTFQKWQLFSYFKHSQVYIFIDMRNMRKRQLDNGKLRLHKHFLFDKRIVENVIVSFLVLSFFQFQNEFVKNFVKKMSLFKIYFEISSENRLRQKL